MWNYRKWKTTTHYGECENCNATALVGYRDNDSRAMCYACTRKYEGTGGDNEE